MSLRYPAAVVITNEHQPLSDDGEATPYVYPRPVSSKCAANQVIHGFTMIDAVRLWIPLAGSRCGFGSPVAGYLSYGKGVPLHLKEGQIHV